MRTFIFFFILSGCLFFQELAAQKTLKKMVFAPDIYIESPSYRKLTQVAAAPKNFKPIVTKKKLVARSEKVQVNIEK